MLQVSFFPTVSELAYRLHLFPTLQCECQSCIARQLAPGTRAQSHTPRAVCWNFFALVSYTPPLLFSDNSKKTTNFARPYFQLLQVDYLFSHILKEARHYFNKKYIYKK